MKNNTIKEKLENLLKEHLPTLKDGKPLQINYAGTSAAYVKVALYEIARQFNLALTISVKDTYIEIKERKSDMAQIAVISAAPEIKLAVENDLDLEEIFGTKSQESN